ncbi:MAG: hypothetical protein ACI8PT_004239 [Gammaproteobacteria bacterium]|jgi:hypothetical protein
MIADGKGTKPTNFNAPARCQLLGQLVQQYVNSHLDVDERVLNELP